MYKLDIKISVYDCTVKVIISKDIEKVINRYGKKLKWDKQEDNVHGLAISQEDMKNYYIFYSEDSLTANFLVHEITHLVDFILEERAIEKEGEAKAYLTGFIAEKIFDFVLKKSLFINKWYKPQIENQKTSDEKPNGLLRESDQDIKGSEKGLP